MSDDFDPDTDPLYSRCVIEVHEIRHEPDHKDVPLVQSLVDYCYASLKTATIDDCKEFYFRTLASLRVHGHPVPELKHVSAFVTLMSNKAPYLSAEQKLMLQATFSSINTALCNVALSMCSRYMIDMAKHLGVTLEVETVDGNAITPIPVAPEKPHFLH